MPEEQYIPTKAEFLADLVTGNASYTSVMGSVQRSHRFPIHIFAQIENLARMGGVPVSLIINQLLECGLDAVLHELSEEVAAQVRLISPALLEGPTVTDRVEVKPKKVAKAKFEQAK